MWCLLWIPWADPRCFPMEPRHEEEEEEEKGVALGSGVTCYQCWFTGDADTVICSSCPLDEGWTCWQLLLGRVCRGSCPGTAGTLVARPHLCPHGCAQGTKTALCACPVVRGSLKVTGEFGWRIKFIRW